MKTLLVTLMTTVSIISQAGVLKDGSTVQTKEGVKIPQTTTLTLDGKETTLSLVGSGVRKKSLLAIKVYLAEVFADKADSFVRKHDKALDSINDSQTVAVRTVFLRDVDAETIMNAFKDGFGVNKIDTKNDQPIKLFLQAVAKGGDGVEGKALTFVMTKNEDGSEKLVYEDSKGKAVTIAGEAGLTKKVMSLWLGKTVDGKAQDMQDEIISGK